MTMKKLIYLALIVPSILVVSCKTTHPAGIYAKAQSTEQQSSVIAAPATQAQVPSNPVSGKENVRKENFKPIATETNQDVVNKKYHVVVGSFGSQLNAQNLAATLKKEGKNPAVVVNENNMYRVIIASYDDYAQATSAKVELQSRFADAWLLVQNK
ncbi:MAG: SPOR domain-containing protein [Paludibacter sp.]|nr:SPOR domain-containing protein [Paludibacter sp.]